MAIKLISATSSSINDSSLDNGLETQINALLATLLNDRIGTPQFQAKDATRYTGVEMTVMIPYEEDEGATITSPYKVKFFQASSVSGAQSAAQTWIDANTDYWIGDVLVQYAPGLSGSTSPYFIMVFYNEDAEDGAVNSGINSSVFKSLPVMTPSTDRWYIGGFYDAPAADANLTQAGATQTYNSANVGHGAHAFVVLGDAGTVDAGTVALIVSGTSIADDGTRAAADSETLLADITDGVTDQYIQSTKRWIGQITFSLVVTGGGAATYSLDFNYGLAQFETLGREAYVLEGFDIIGESGANEGSFDVTVFKHATTGWTYSAAAFTPGGTTLANLQTDYNTEYELVNGEFFSYQRYGLASLIDGANGEGVIIAVDTPTSASALTGVGASIKAAI